MQRSPGSHSRWNGFWSREHSIGGPLGDPCSTWQFGMTLMVLLNSKYVVILDVVTACPAGAAKLSMQLSACACEAQQQAHQVPVRATSASLAATQKSSETYTDADKHPPH